MEKSISNEDIANKIGHLIEEARKQTYIQINTIMVKTYWKIGRTIIEEEQDGKIKAKYGENLILNLSKELTKTYGKGFSERNLRDFRKFYTEFQKPETLSAKLAWSHYTILLRIDDKLKRNFYL